MAIIKDKYPILEYDEEQIAVIMPNRREKYKFPEKCVFAFLGDTVEKFAIENNAEIIGEFESITKKYLIYKINYKGEEICFCHAPCGSAPATQILDFLIACGVKYIISCGTCGALKNFKENEFIIPIEALRDEGTSYHYIKPSRSIKLNEEAINSIRQAVSSFNLNYIECKTWTTDGFFRETKEMVKYRVEEVCKVVEMECSALAACASFRNIVFGELLFTADTLFSLEEYSERNWGMDSFELALKLSFESLGYINK